MDEIEKVMMLDKRRGKLKGDWRARADENMKGVNTRYVPIGLSNLPIFIYASSLSYNQDYFLLLLGSELLEILRDWRTIVFSFKGKVYWTIK